jgi:Gas vesicle synthesis protein GvpL/GvpF
VAEYVYGIVESGAKPPAARGIADAPLRLIAGETACALVSDLTAEELRLGREEMLAHARVLEEALAHGTVLPMRFGVLMEGPDEVRERLLDNHASELTVQLARFQDHIEMNVRGVYVEDPLMREVVEEDSRIARLRETVRSYPEEATYARRLELGELVAHAIERKRDVDAGYIIDVLTPYSVAYEVGTPAHERVVVNAAFLVSRDRVDEFDAALDEIARDQADRIRFKSTGPLPPHSFVELAGSG